jgi:hypothetical protein
VGGERKTEVGLGEGRDCAPKGVGHGESGSRIGFNGDESTFMKVNGETGGLGEGIQDMFQVGHMLGDGPNDNKRIIGVLKDGASEVVHKGVEEESLPRSKKEHLLKDIGDNVEEEMG